MAVRARNCSYLEILTHYQKQLASVEELSFTCPCNARDLFEELQAKKEGKVELDLDATHDDFDYTQEATTTATLSGWQPLNNTDSPFQIAKNCSNNVDSYFEKFGEFFLSLKNVKKLTISEGFFSLKTTRFFPNLTSLTIQCKLTPDRKDEISDQLLQNIKHLELSQIKDADF